MFKPKLHTQKRPRMSTAYLESDCKSPRACSERVKGEIRKLSDAKKLFP